MFGVWLWWTVHRLIWALLPLPSSMGARDKLLANRAAKVIARHYRAMRAPASFDPYDPEKPLKGSPRDAALVMQAKMRAGVVLVRHSLPGHLLNALLRERDPEGIAQAKKAEQEIAAEKAAATSSTT
jgi:hypothetical protein